MNFAQIISGQPVALNPALAVAFEREGQVINASYQTVMLWSDDERAAIGVYPIVDDAIPEGKVATGSTLENDNGTIRRRWTLEDAPPPPVPAVISDRQFAHVLALQGLITQDEALAWVKTGDVPSALQALVDEIPDPVIKFSAQMLLAGATVFERDHPMTAQLAAGLGMSSEQVDDLWRAAAAL